MLNAFGISAGQLERTVGRWYALLAQPITTAGNSSTRMCVEKPPGDAQPTLLHLLLRNVGERSMNCHSVNCRSRPPWAVVHHACPTTSARPVAPHTLSNRHDCAAQPAPSRPQPELAPLPTRVVSSFLRSSRAATLSVRSGAPGACAAPVSAADTS